MFLIGGLVAVPILALIYSYAIWYIPFPYINFILAGVFGYAIGMAIIIIMIRMGKVRNKNLARFFAILGAFLGLYFAWAVWADLAIHVGDSFVNVRFSEVLALVLNPGLLFELIGEINSVGVWGLKSTAVSGTPLTIIWIIEAIIIVGVALLVSSGASSQPFCEINKKWFDTKDAKPHAFLTDPEPIIDALASGDVETVQGVEVPLDGAAENHSVWQIYFNETNENYLSIVNKVKKVNDKGDVSFEDHPVVEYLSISEQIANMLMSR